MQLKKIHIIYIYEDSYIIPINKFVFYANFYAVNQLYEYLEGSIQYSVFSMKICIFNSKILNT